MADSVGAAAARGIESGFGLGQRMYDAEDRRKERELQQVDRQEDRAFQREERGLRAESLRAQAERQKSQDARQLRTDVTSDIDGQLKFLDQDLNDLKGEFDGMLKTAGSYESIDPAALENWNGRFKGVRAKRAELRDQRYRPDVETQRRTAADTASRLATGQVSIDDLPDVELHNAVQFQTRRPIDDFISGDGVQPSKIRQGIMDFEAGQETGNEQLMLAGLNVLFKPELSIGIGQESHDGSEIIDKSIYALAPHPDPARAAEGDLIPVLEVTAQRPDGAVGKYRVPVTEDRSSYFGNEQAMPKVINLKDGFERIGQLGTLERTVNQPGLKDRLLKGKEEAGPAAQEALANFYALGGSVPKKKPIERERITVDGQVIERELDPETKEIKSERKLGLAGTSRDVREAVGLQAAKGGKGGAGGGGKPSALDRKITSIKDAVELGDLSAEEGENAIKKALGVDVKGMGKQAQVDEAMKNKRTGAIAQADRLIQTVDEAAKLVGVTTSGVGSVLSKIPGTSARDLEATLTTIKANLGFAELQAMRDASPTGGALGAIAVQELNALQSTVASLDAGQSPSKLKASLAKIRGHYKAWRDAMDQAGTAADTEGIEPVDRGAGSPDNPQRASGTVSREAPQIAVNPKTGEKLILKDGKWQPMK